jgi:hypothetical protein
MRLLKYEDDGELTITSFNDNAIPPYAILSHTWGADKDEVTFADIVEGSGKTKHGYIKIHFCREQARTDNLQYFWIDTCCIDKANKAELMQAIKSMFRWYRNSTRCYVYLSDVSSTSGRCSKPSCPPLWESSFRKSNWFSRGWTLQELLAPNSVEFFSREQRRLGDKKSLIQPIHEITRIPHSALQGAPLSQFSFEERLKWSDGRHTKVKEDKAYILLGLFDIYIPPRYSEGADKAFRRFQVEFNRLSKFIQSLRAVDPRDDKKRIEETKGRLLVDSYR